MTPLKRLHRRIANIPGLLKLEQPGRTRFAGVRAAGACLAVALALAGCTGFGLGTRNAPINAALTGDAALADSAPSGPLSQDAAETAIGLSFSGGGTRASAFAYGVLQELAKTQETSHGVRGPLIDRVTLVSGVSGGSVTAAYFALRGRDMLSDFRHRFLVQDVEATLSTSVNVTNLMLMAKGGVNDRSGLPTWLDQNLFHGATYADVLKPGHPLLWINASDIFNRTPFIYNTVNFGALCSDLRRYPLSEAVAASAAVPLVFRPIVIENFADTCPFNAPDWVNSAASRTGAPAILRASAAAIQRYREKSDVKFVKLLDGGMTDNLGLSGLLLELAAATKPYEPLTPRQAVNLKRFLFIVVDAGRPPGGDLAKNADSPEIMDLIQAVSDTAVDANVRAAYDAFGAEMEKWRDRLIEYRCGLTPPEVVALRGSMEGWNAARCRCR